MIGRSTQGRKSRSLGISRLARTAVALALLSFLALFSSQVLAATTRYVTDQLEITLRSGQSTKHQILRMLKSGAKLNILETNSDTGYSHVRTVDGTDGWVLTRYLVNVAGARERLAEAEKKIVKLEITNTRIQEALDRLTQEHKKVDAERQKLSEDKRRLNSELNTIRQTASSTLAIDSENKTLKARQVKLEREYQAVREESDALRDRTARDWFMVGAGVLLLGIITGLIIPKLRFRRKSSWDSL